MSMRGQGGPEVPQAVMMEFGKRLRTWFDDAQTAPPDHLVALLEQLPSAAALAVVGKAPPR